MTPAVVRLQASADEIDRATARVQLRAGSMIAQELKESAANFEKEIRSATEALLATVKQNQTRLMPRPRLHWLAIGIAIAGFLFLLGAYLDSRTEWCIHAGG